MSHLLALDPGRQGFGWALFTDQILTACGVVPQPKPVRDFAPVDVTTVARAFVSTMHEVLPSRLFDGAYCDAMVVIERMRVYPRTTGRAESEQRRTAVANDLIDLSELGGLVAGTLRPRSIKYYTAHAWKGSTDTAVIERRLLGLGSLAFFAHNEADLLLRVKPKGLRHNAVDAVALGLVALGRWRLT